MPIYYRGKPVIHIIINTPSAYRDKTSATFKYAYSYRYKNKTYFTTDEMLLKFIYKDNSNNTQVTSLSMIEDSKTYDVAVCTNKKDLNLYLAAYVPATDDGTESVIPEILVKGIKGWNAQFKSLIDNKYYNYLKIPEDKLNNYDVTFANAKFLATVVNKPSTTNIEESTYARIGIGVSPLSINYNRAFGFNQLNRDGYDKNELIYNNDTGTQLITELYSTPTTIINPTKITNYDILIPIIHEGSAEDGYAYNDDLVIATDTINPLNCNIFMGLRLGLIYKGRGTKPSDFYNNNDIEWYDINFNKLEGRDYNIDNMIYLKNSAAGNIIERFRLKEKFNYWFYFNVVGLIVNPYFVIQPVQGVVAKPQVKIVLRTYLAGYSKSFEFKAV